jgi:hypothetical protein
MINPIKGLSGEKLDYKYYILFNQLGKEDNIIILQKLNQP